MTETQRWTPRVIKGGGEQIRPMTESEGILVDEAIEAHLAKFPDASALALELVMERALGRPPRPGLYAVDGEVADPAD